LGAAKENDQKASPLILEHLQAGDLVIRDLDYAALKVWRQIIAQGAYFLRRWRNDLGLFDPQTNPWICWLGCYKIPNFVLWRSWWAPKNA
jgi:hypothetical protein